MKAFAFAAALAVLSYAIPAHASDATAERSLARRAPSFVSTEPTAVERADDPCGSCCMRTMAEKPDAGMRHVPGHK